MIRTSDASMTSSVRIGTSRVVFNPRHNGEQGSPVAVSDRRAAEIMAASSLNSAALDSAISSRRFSVAGADVRLSADLGNALAAERGA